MRSLTFDSSRCACTVSHVPCPLCSRRKHAVASFVTSQLLAYGVQVTFHPAARPSVTVEDDVFEQVKGRAGREPLM